MLEPDTALLLVTLKPFLIIGGLILLAIIVGVCIAISNMIEKLKKYIQRQFS